MEIKWSNVVAFALGLTALIILVRMHREIAEFVSFMGCIGPGHNPQEQATGLVAVGMICVVIVAVVKIVLNSGGKNP
jgi:hypothetical protein